MNVSDVMSKDYLTVGPDDNVVDVGTELDKKNLSGAVVLSDSKILGVVSKETFIANLHVLGGDTHMESCLVKDFMEANIIPLKADEDIFAAVDKLQDLPKQLDRLPVISEGRLVGVLSKTELTELYAKDMKGRFKVRDIMHYNPPTVESYDTLESVIAEVKSSGTKSVLVMEGKNLSGIITIRDLSLNIFREKKTCGRVDALSMLIAEDVMTRSLITISEKQDSAEAAGLMVEKGIGSLPVVNGELKGIVTRTDLLKGYKLIK
ncbi:MAG: CBS domain-containing protein [Candidatus Altiarchaeota archaeon]